MQNLKWRSDCITLYSPATDRAYFWLELIIDVNLYSCEREGGKTVLRRNFSLNKGRNKKIMADKKTGGKLLKNRLRELKGKKPYSTDKLFECD